MGKDEITGMLKVMIEFRSFANSELFEEVFESRRKGEHLWSKFREFNYDLIKFAKSLDSVSVDQLAEAFVTLETLIQVQEEIPF